MQEPAPHVADPAADRFAAWAASLPPPPYVDPTAGAGAHRFVPLSPRVAVLIGAAVVLSPHEPEALAISLRSIGMGPADG